MNFFNKHKLAILILVFFLFPYFARAGTCSSVGYSIYTINGINTDLTGAQDNKKALGKNLPSTYNNQPLTVDFLLNPTHGPIVDVIDSGAQKFSDNFSADINDADLASMLTDASQKVTTQKLLLVSHSQGNFYANAFYDTVLDATGGVPGQSIGVYSVATPANRVAGNGLYLTSDTDNVIDPIPGILKPNTHINFQASDDSGMGHDFSKIYLAYQGDRIVSDIKSSLNKLQNNNVQSENALCINPPKLTVTQNVQGLALNIIDPVSIPVQTAIVYTAATSYKIGAAISNGYLALINNTGAILANAIGGLAVNNSAAVINSEDQSTDTSQNTSQNTASDDKTEALLPSAQNSTPTNFAEALLPQNQFVPSAPSVISPVVVRQDLTTATPQNLYPNLLPGGGGVAAPNDVFPPSPPSPEPPVPPSPPTSPFEIDATPPVITVLGNNPETIEAGSTYNDAGATAFDTVDGVRNVSVSGTVNTAIVGSYTLTYTATDLSDNIGTATRAVNVVDTTAPVITILGSNPTTVTINSAYTDAGATALDSADGVITVNTSGAVNTSVLGVYTLTYTATDATGNISTATRDVKVSSFVYIPKYSFGSDNGDGNDWQVWSFNGSNVYDWKDTYVNNYLREQFKIQTYPGGYWTMHPLQRGIFNHDPEKGFELSDMVVSGLEDNPQNNMNGTTYDVALQWDSTGYVYTISHGSVVDSTGHTDVANMNNDLWVGWNSAFNNLNFQTFPVGSWQGIVPYSPLDREGGGSMMLQPYPVYKNQSAPITPTLTFPTSGPYAVNGIDPSRGRAKLTPFSFQVVYTDPNNNAPQNVTLHIINASSGISVREINMFQTSVGADILSDGNFSNGELYIALSSTYELADYEYYFTAEDSSGNNMQIPENNRLKFSVISSTYTYIPKYQFGTGNGDGNDWEVWTFNGSNVYDWSDTYVNHYLNQQFKVQHYGNGLYYTRAPLIKGIFTHNPLLGFESSDILRTDTIDTNNNPQYGPDGIYDVNIQWDSTGYTTTILYNSSTVTVDAVHTDVANMNNDLWVGWNSAFNNLIFQTFPSGNWTGSAPHFIDDRMGGNTMILQPYPVYAP